MKNRKEKMIRAIQLELNASEFKKTMTSLDNLFVGSMVLASIMFLNWLWMALGWWLVILPLCYLGVCYVGKFLKRGYGIYNDRKRTNKSNPINLSKCEVFEFNDSDLV